MFTNIALPLLILSFLISIISIKGYKLKNKDVNSFEDSINVFEDENIDEGADIQYVDGSPVTRANKLSYNIVHPQNMEYDEYDKLKDYVIIKAKRKRFDTTPYKFIRHLDKVKFMVMWLNTYCEMHPDCNKEKLNEQLQEVTSATINN